MSESIIKIDDHGLGYSQWSELETIARKVIDAGITKVGNVTQVCMIIVRGRTLGLDMFQSLENIAIINGKTLLASDLMAALVEHSGQLVSKKWSFAGKGEERSCTVTAQRKGREADSWSFSIADAKKADLLGKSSWKSWPDNMLFHRAQANVLRRTFPDILAGIYAVEEFDQIVEEPEPARVIEAEVVHNNEEPVPEVPVAPREVKPVETGSPQGKLLELASQDGMDEAMLLQVLKRMKHIDAESIADLTDDKANLFAKNWAIIRDRTKTLFPEHWGKK